MIRLVQMCCGLLLCCAVTITRGQEPPAKGIQDNSFFVEEAYNQEPGVVQHILNVFYSSNGSERAWDLAFTQEWPLFSQLHQISYTVPYGFLREGGHWIDGPGDVLLNYRFQALLEDDRRPAFAPRLSLILPTGDSKLGFGTDTVGGQVNLPVSKVVSDRWTIHGNIGATIVPQVKGHTLENYNVGGSAIYAVNSNFNLMLECVGNFDEEVKDRGGTNRTTSLVLSPGMRYGINHPGGAQTVLGIAVPVGLTRDAPDFGVFFYFSFEHAFMRRTENAGGSK